jgi:hypothetical protein
MLDNVYPTSTDEVQERRSDVWAVGGIPGSSANAEMKHELPKKLLS